MKGRLAIVLTTIGILFALTWCCRPYLSNSDQMRRVCMEYNDFIAYIETQKNETAQYPLTGELPVQWSAKLSNDPLLGRYTSDGTRFTAAFGNYAKDGFVIYYSSFDGDWHIDE